jgi:hypothetical protein
MRASQSHTECPAAQATAYIQAHMYDTTTSTVFFLIKKKTDLPLCRDHLCDLKVSLKLALSDAFKGLVQVRLHSTWLLSL